MRALAIGDTAATELVKTKSELANLCGFDASEAGVGMAAVVVGTTGTTLTGNTELPLVAAVGIDQTGWVFGAFDPLGAFALSKCRSLAVPIDMAWFHMAALTRFAAGERFLVRINVIFDHAATRHRGAGARAIAGGAWIRAITVGVGSALATTVFDTKRPLRRAVFAGGALYTHLGGYFLALSNELLSGTALGGEECEQKEREKGAGIHGVFPSKL